MVRVSLGLCLVTALFSVGCDRPPRDPQGTLDRVRGGVLRVGWNHHPPWCAARADGAEPGESPSGPDAERVRAVARELGARVRWVPGDKEELLDHLTRFELDLVACGVPRDTPWKKKIGLTRAPAGQHALAAPPGENGWLMFLDRALLAREGDEPTRPAVVR